MRQVLLGQPSVRVWLIKTHLDNETQTWNRMKRKSVSAWAVFCAVMFVVGAILIYIVYQYRYREELGGRKAFNVNDIIGTSSSTEREPNSKEVGNWSCSYKGQGYHSSFGETKILFMLCYRRLVETCCVSFFMYLLHYTLNGCLCVTNLSYTEINRKYIRA